jgi:hypothetical protein
MVATDRRYKSLFEQKYKRGEIASVPDHGVCPLETVQRGDYLEIELHVGADMLGSLGLRVRESLGMHHGGPAYEVELLGASTPQAMAYAESMLKSLKVETFAVHICEAQPSCRYKMGGEWVVHTDEVRQRFEDGPLPSYFTEGPPAEDADDRAAPSGGREPAVERVVAAAEAMGYRPGPIAPGTTLVPITTRVRKKRAPGMASRRAPDEGVEERGPADDRGPPPRLEWAR